MDPCTNDVMLCLHVRFPMELEGAHGPLSTIGKHTCKQSVTSLVHGSIAVSSMVCLINKQYLCDRKVVLEIIMNEQNKPLYNMFNVMFIFFCIDIAFLGHAEMMPRIMMQLGHGELAYVMMYTT